MRRYWTTIVIKNHNRPATEEWRGGLHMRLSPANDVERFVELRLWRLIRAHVVRGSRELVACE
jgi:hypothetical protein